MLNFAIKRGCFFYLAKYRLLNFHKIAEIYCITYEIYSTENRTFEIFFSILNKSCENTIVITPKESVKGTFFFTGLIRHTFCLILRM